MKKIVYLCILSVTAFMSSPKVADAQIITTIAGTGAVGDTGDGGPATAAEMSTPCGMALFGHNLYVGDIYTSCVRKVNLLTGVITTFAGSGIPGFSGDGGPATAAALAFPYGVAADGVGNIYIADEGNTRIRKVDTAGIITTFAGNGTSGYSGDGGPATAAVMSDIDGVAADHAGNVYIADLDNNCIRKVNTSGIISTIAGNTTMGFSGDGGPATAAELNHVVDVSVDVTGNLYITDYGNNVLRKVDTFGVITTIAGNLSSGYSGDGGPATAASCNEPQGMYIDATGNIFITDINNNVVRKINPSGIITTIAGTGAAGYAGDGGPATAALLSRPSKIVGDPAGNLYICDFNNNCVRKMPGSLTTGTTSVSKNTASTCIFPNPSDGTFSICASLNESSGASALLEVTDMLGQAIYKENIPVQKGRINSPVVLRTVASGDYMLTIISGTTSYTEHFVIKK